MSLMSRFLTPIVVICIVSITTVSQSNPRPRFFCGYSEGNRGSELCSKIQATSFMSDEAAEKTVERVLAPFGLNPNFVLLPCDQLDNAAAVTYDDGIRYIIYNRAFMTRIAKVSDDWASLGIVAHEIGHHLQGHTTRRMSFPPSREELRQSRMQELEADEFSGFVMYKLGASLAQAQSAMVVIRDVREEELSTHPKRSRRVAAIENGYKKAEVQNSIGVIAKSVSAEDFYLKGNDEFKDKNYRRAIDFYSAAIAINPNYRGAYFRRAFARSNGLEDYKGAIEDYTTAIELYPTYIAAYNNRGTCRAALKDYKGAIDDYTKAIGLDPNYALAYYNRANSKSELNDNTDAIEDYTVAIRLKPDDAEYYYNRASSRADLDDHQGAIDDYTVAIKLNPIDSDAYYNRAISKTKLKDYKGAIEDYTTAIRLKPEDADAYHNRANCRVDLNDYKGAIEDYTSAIRLKPDNTASYKRRGYARQKSGDLTGACEDFRKACSLDKEFCTALNSCKP